MSLNDCSTAQSSRTNHHSVVSSQSLSMRVKNVPTNAVSPRSKSATRPQLPLGTLNSPKSSLALREAIARAKAAKKKNVQPGSGAPNSFSQNADAFGQSPQINDHDIGIQSLLVRARSSGKLNISGRELKEIPEDVYNMYHVKLGSVDLSTSEDDAWYNNVHLTTFVASDNEITRLDARLVEEFGGIELVDMRNNKLQCLPSAFIELTQLTSLNLSRNNLDNQVIALISSISPLRILHLAENRLTGPLFDLGLLKNLEVLDISRNAVTSISSYSKLRILNAEKCRLVDIPLIESLVELKVGQNKLSKIPNFPNMRSLDCHGNSLTSLPALPSSITIDAASNQISTVDTLSESLITLLLSDNALSTFPKSILSQSSLTTLDISANQIKELPGELGLMDSLKKILLEGNLIRDKSILTKDCESIKRLLRTRMGLE